MPKTKVFYNFILSFRITVRPFLVRLPVSSNDKRFSWNKSIGTDEFGSNFAVGFALNDKN
jgi:hypothetical protein